MATYGTNEFKGGLKIMLDGDPHAIVENEFVKPGKTEKVLYDFLLQLPGKPGREKYEKVVRVQLV